MKGVLGVLIMLMLVILLLDTLNRIGSSPDVGGSVGPPPQVTETLYEQARSTDPPEYHIVYEDSLVPEYYQIGCVTERAKHKAAIGAIAFQEARDRGVDHILLVCAETEEDLRNRNVFGGAHLDRRAEWIKIDTPE